MNKGRKKSVYSEASIPEDIDIDIVAISLADSKNVETIPVDRDDGKASMAEYKNVETVPAILRSSVSTMTREALIGMYCEMRF